MGFRNNLRHCLRMLTITEIAVAQMVLPGWVGMRPKIGSVDCKDRSDGRNSIGAEWKPSRYWDAVVPISDSLRSTAAKSILPSPSISAGSVISGQMVRHVHV